MADRCAAAYATAIERHVRGDLLDVGCGKVPLYGAYNRLVSSTTCIDWPSSLHGSLHVDVEADLGEPLPIDDATFDTIIATDVLEHLPYPDVLWSEMSRLLRPSGKVVIGVPFMYWIHESPHDHFRYTEHRLRLFCEDHNLSVLECQSYGGPVDVAADLTCKLLNRRRTTRALIGPIIAGAKRFGGPTPGSPLPLGYILVAEKKRD